MTGREMGFIRSAARGLRQAQQQLRENPKRYLQEAMEAMAEERTTPLSNADAAYYAAMLLAWEDAGRPDCFA